MRITPEEFAKRIIADIEKDFESGEVPRTVRTFSELHDYFDANCYGGSEQLLQELESEYPDTDEGHMQALNAHCDLMNAAVVIVEEWLVSR